MSENALSQLGQLATVGATTLLTAVATDLWSEIRQRAWVLLGRRDRRRDSTRRGVFDESWRQAPAEQMLATDPEFALAVAVLLREISARMPVANLEDTGRGRPPPGTDRR